MGKVLAILLTAIALTGCGKPGFSEPTAGMVNDVDFSYLLTHISIVKESPLSYKLPKGSNSSYRILGVTQQGNCVGGCPPSTIYVAAYNYMDHPDGHIRLCRIDGIRWFSQVRVTSYKPAVKGGVFLVFDVRSNIEPDMYRLYQVSVAPDECSIEFVKEVRRGT
jgi:hypothetical protein